MSLETISEIDAEIAANKQTVNLGLALTRLTSNQDFKAVILSGYLEKEALRLVRIKADPSMQDMERQTAITVGIDSIGWFQQYLASIERNAQMAAKHISDCEELREDILQGSVD